LAQAILTGPHRRTMTADQRDLLGFLVRAHQTHARVFDVEAPTTRPAKIDQLSLGQSLIRLASNEKAAATRHRTSALATRGGDAARLGAAAIAAGRYAAVVTKDEHTPLASRTTWTDVPVQTDVAAVQGLVAQLHAVVYGYQLAIGQLKVVSARHDQAVAELLRLRIRRERLISWLLRREADVPPAEPAYRPTVQPRDPGTAAKLIRTMLVAVEPFCAVWLAAAGDADREWAFSTFGAMDDLARGWNAPLAIWPGSFG
jgi:Domain of unknown function (DUF4439)